MALRQTLVNERVREKQTVDSGGWDILLYYMRCRITCSCNGGSDRSFVPGDWSDCCNLA